MLARAPAFTTDCFTPLGFRPSSGRPACRQDLRLLVHPEFQASRGLPDEVRYGDYCRATRAALLTSYTYAAMVPSLIFSTASLMAPRGTRNHSRGTTGVPNRSSISISRRAGAKIRWMSFSSFPRSML